MQRRLNFSTAVAFFGLALLGMVFAENSAGWGKDPAIIRKTYSIDVNGK